MKTAAANLVTDQARDAVVETAGDESAVGAQVSVESTEDGLMSVRFACTLPGYLGWEWSVDLAILDGVATVCETALLPGPTALRAPSWVPWSERVRPGDLEPGMVLPFVADDPRLVPGYTVTGDVDRDEQAIFEFGLGRERVLAPEARDDVADRWYRGSHGPSAPSALASAVPCAMCAFFTPLAGSFRTLFGACTNEWSPSDGRVVSVDHGCGAHSQTEAERRLSEWPSPDPIVDSGAVDVLDLNAPDPVVEEPAVAEPAAEQPEAEPLAVEPVSSAPIVFIDLLDDDALVIERNVAPRGRDAAVVEEAVTDDAPVAEDAPAEDAPHEDFMAERGISWVITVDDTDLAAGAVVADAWAMSVEEFPADDAPADDAPADDAPEDEAAAE